MPLNIKVAQESDEALALMLTGSIDSDTAPELEGTLADMVHPQISYVGLNMAGVTFISSAGLRVVFKVLKQMKAREGQLLVTEMSPRVEKVFEIVKMIPDLSIFASHQEMDDYLAVIQQRESDEG